MGGRLKGDALVEAVAERLGYRFRDSRRLEHALTHSSARSGARENNERLEFLGDRVLGLIVAELLFRSYPGAPEGELALRLNALVSGSACAEVADEIGLASLIRADSGLRALGGQKARSVRADAMEAVIAAIYLDGGLEAVRPVVLRFWEPRSRAAGSAWRDAKTELQEWAHQRVAATPAYTVLDRSGPDHDPVFSVEVTVPGLAGATGTGRSKREAEQAAALSMLEREGALQARSGDAA